MSAAASETPVAPSQQPVQPPVDDTPETTSKNQEPWFVPSTRGREMSVRSNKSRSSTMKDRVLGLSMASLREPELSQKMFRLVKGTRDVGNAYETAGQRRVTVAVQLAEWGEQTADYAIGDLADKVGVILTEIGELDKKYAIAADVARTHLKLVRDTERSVHPSREGMQRVTDELQKMMAKDPQSDRVVMLEQEFQRARAKNLVAEAQLTNVTRQNFKEAYRKEFDAVIERAEKQIIMARHGHRLLRLLDYEAVPPGSGPQPYTGETQARQILNDAKDDLRDWTPESRSATEYGSDGENLSSSPAPSG